MTEREELRGVLAEHAARYPLMQPQDAVKLIYQNEFGPGHLVADQSQGFAFFQKEQAGAPSGAPLFEPIGGGLCRIYLGPAAASGLAAETVYRMFLHCAGIPRGSKEGLEQKLLWGMPPEMPFSREALENYLKSYRGEGYPMVRHSEIYRERYRPAYRLVEEQCAAYWRFFAAIDQLLKQKGTVTVAIDGNSGAGKSSLASLAESVYHCTVYHMDDYFLPPARKTPERLAQPGGNVDYERFRQEVLAGLAGTGPFYYRPYSCRTGELEAPVLSSPGRLRIIEGVYSLHPTLRDAYDLKVFLSVNPQEQSRRILHRSGPALHRRFIKEWIPLEERYFSGCGVPGQCQLVLKSDEKRDFYQ